jgi:hypothetical protein
MLKYECFDYLDKNGIVLPPTCEDIEDDFAEFQRILKTPIPIITAFKEDRHRMVRWLRGKGFPYSRYKSVLAFSNNAHVEIHTERYSYMYIPN